MTSRALLLYHNRIVSVYSTQVTNCGSRIQGNRLRSALAADYFELNWRKLYSEHRRGSACHLSVFRFFN